MKILAAHRPWPAYRSLLLAAVLLLGLLPNGAVAADRCYAEWSDAAPIVARERLRTTRDVQEMAREHFGGDVVRIMLCQEAERFVYRAIVRRDDGRISTSTASAASTTQAAEDLPPRR